MLNVREHGAKGDAQSTTDGAMSAGSAVLTSESAAFVANDVGKSVSVAGAGSGGGTLVGKIAASPDAQTVELDPVASTTVSQAVVNWGTDDTAAIQATIDTAKASQGTVYFPPGRYRLTHAIRPEADNMTLYGSSAAVLVADPADDEQFPEAILVHKSFPLGPDAVRHLTLRGFSVDMKNGIRADTWSAGAIQLNNCPDCLVTDMCLTYSGSSPKPMNLDGISVSNGTTGLITACTVDAFPKVGIYLARGSHDVQVVACKVTNTRGPIGQAGISVTASDRITLANCISSRNGLTGLLIAVNGPTPGNPPSPATNIQVIGGMYNNNGLNGILIASGYDGVQPRNIQLLGIASLNNDGDGIRVEAGWDIQIASPLVADNGGVGIWIENVAIGSSMARSRRVQVNDANVVDNGRLVNVDVPGIGLRAVDHVTVDGGLVSRTPTVPGRRQVYGIGLYRSPVGDGASTNVRILDLDASEGQIKPVEALDLHGFPDASAAAQTGYYRLHGTGDPEGSLAAPLASEYVDLLTGLAYRKTDGSGSVGWQVL
jgi:hypothetical protein